MLALGGPARQVMAAAAIEAQDSTYSAPQWSPDGEELAGVVESSEGVFVEVVSMKTRESTRLALAGRSLTRMDLSWSPDGHFFAYVDGNLLQDVTQLRLLRVSDEKSFEVTNGRTKVWSPSWSADGQKLFFISNRRGSMDLWQQRLGPEGEPQGDPWPVTVAVGMRHAVFSPDGTKLAYSQGRRVANIWKVPILEDRLATWADAEQVTFDEAFAEHFDISPDGDRLLFSSDRSGNMDLWMMPVDGGEMIQMTTDPTPDWAPRWSPDGTEIAFHALRSGNREIWVMPVSGGPARQLTDSESNGTQSFIPDWSPDGREIAFTVNRDIKADIYVISAEDGDARRLTTHPEDNWLVDWSPDGEWIVFFSGGALWRVPAAGGDAEALTSSSAGYPRWSRDGNHIFYIERYERTGNLWALALEDGSERALTDLAGRRGRVGIHGLATDGRYLYFRWQEDFGDIWVMDVVTEDQ